MDGMPRLTGLEHDVHDREQLAHARDDDNLGQLASQPQALGEACDVGVVADGGLGAHVQHASHVGATAQMRRRPRRLRLSLASGATPTSLEISRRLSVPSSGHMPSMVRLRTGPCLMEVASRRMSIYLHTDQVNRARQI